MEIEPVAEFKEWMEGKYGDQCNDFAMKKFTAENAENAHLLVTCEA